MTSRRHAAFLTVKRFGDDLARECAAFEQNVRSKLADDNARAFGPFEIVGPYVGNARALPWQIVRVDPSGSLGGLDIAIPSPRAPNVGWILVKNESISFAPVVVTPDDGTIDGGADLTIAAMLGSVLLAPDRVANNWIAIRCDCDGTIDLSDIPPGPEGYVLTTVGGVVVWAPPAGGGASGAWETRYDPDLLGHASFTYPTSVPDTAHTVDGVSIWAKHTSNGTIAINPTPGAGIELAQTSATGQFFSSTPCVYIELPDVGPFKVSGGPLRIHCQFELVAGFSVDSFSNMIGMGIGSQAGPFVVHNLCRVQRGVGQMVAHGVTNAASADSYQTQQTPLTTNDTMVFWLHPPFSAEYGFSQYSGGYTEPAEPQGKIFYMNNPAGAASSLTGFVVNRPGAGNVHGYRVVMGINTGNGGGPLGTVRFKRLRIQEWVPGY